MTTLYFNQIENKFYKYNDNINSIKIKYGEPITIEYIKLRIVSKKFNRFFKNRIMIIDNIKTIQTKEITADSISYYDENVIPNKFKDKNPNKYYDINDFDPTKYGNPIFYHTKAYQNNDIYLTTRVFKIEKDEIANNIFGCLHNIFTIGSKIPNYGILANIAEVIVDDANKIFDDLNNSDKQIIKNHIISFKSSNIYIGKYICLPNITDHSELQKFLLVYNLIDDKLIRINNKNEEIEYGDTYYIIEITNNERDDLNDFDYSASSNELLKCIHKSDQMGIEKFSKCTKDASDLNIIKNITELWDNNPEENSEIKVLYNYLHDKKWFDINFKHIKDKIF